MHGWGNTRVCPGTIVNIRGQFTALGSIILSCGFWRVECGYQAWQHVHLSTQPSLGTRNFFFQEMIYISSINIEGLFKYVLKYNSLEMG